MRFDTILVPTDLSTDAQYALDVAFHLAQATQARVCLLHVCHLPAYAYVNGGLTVPRPEELHADLVAEAQAALAREREARLARGQALQTVCLEGEPVELLLRYADRQPSCLIVMGTHGRRGLRRLALGSVTEQVIRRSRHPVLAVHAGEGEAAVTTTA